MSGPPGPSQTGKAIASLAKMPSDTTRAGTQKMKFVPTLPLRRKKEEVKQEPAAHAASSASTTPGGASSDRGARGQGRVRGRGGDASRGGRGGVPSSRPPPQEMTASGPFAMGPTQAGSSAWHGGARISSATPTAPRGHIDAAALGANLTKSGAPTLKKERGGTRHADDGDDDDGDDDDKDAARTGGANRDENGELYSEPDDGVEIVDMRNVHAMDWMAPECLKWESARDKSKKKKAAKVKKEEGGQVPIKGKAKLEAMAVDVDVPPATDDVGDINLANALDLSESEEEEELEDIIDDFSHDREDHQEGDLRQERLYFFQFPAPFPTFIPPSATRSDDPGEGSDVPASSEGKRVSFSADTKPPAAVPEDVDKEEKKPPAHVDGVIGQLEIYQSGAVKMRLANGILLDVTAATQPSFLQQAVHVDRASKDLRVLGEIGRRFVVTPNIDSLLAAMTQADDEKANAPNFETDGLISMDTT